MKRMFQITGLILIILLAVSSGYYAGRESVKLIDEETFYAKIEEIREKDIMVQGLEINDINKRWKFQLSIKEDTELVWRGIPIIMEDLRTGDIISITYTGVVSETSPAQIREVVRIQALGDEMEERQLGTTH